MADVFISYAREDRAWVELLAEAVEATGLTVWWDRRQRLGKSFDQQIVAELEDAAAVVVVWSQHSIGSMWVKDEATEGRDREILVPILKDSSAPPLGFKQLHCANLAGWTGGEHDELATILKELRVLAGKTVLETPARRAKAAEATHAVRPATVTRASTPRLTMKEAPVAVVDPVAARQGASLWSRIWPFGGAKPDTPPDIADEPETTTLLPPSPTREIRVDLHGELKGHDAKVVFAAFSPDGTRILTTSSDNTARLWQAGDGMPLAVMMEHTNSVESAAYAPGGDIIATASWDGDIRLWTGEGGAIRVLEGHTDDVGAVAFSPDGKTLASAGRDTAVRLWDVATGACTAVLAGHTGAVRTIAYSSDGKRLVSAAWDETARLWDAAGKPLAVLKGHTHDVHDASFSPDGHLIVTASYDGTARLWDGTDGTPIKVLNGHEDTVWVARFSADGQRVATGSSDRTARLWDTETGASVAVLTRHGARVASLAFSSVGNLLVTASEDRTARLWDAATGAPMATLAGHGGQVWHAAFAPDGTALVTACADRSARLWRIAAA